MIAWILGTLAVTAYGVVSYYLGKKDGEKVAGDSLVKACSLAADFGAGVAIMNTANALDSIASGDKPLILSEIARNADVKADEASDVLDVVASLLREDFVVIDDSTVTFKVGA